MSVVLLLCLFSENATAIGQPEANDQVVPPYVE